MAGIAEDPYYSTRDKVNASLDKLSQKFSPLKERCESGEQSAALLTAFQLFESEIKQVKKEAKSLRKTVVAIEQRREVFKNITDSELNTRKKVINEIASRLKAFEKYVEEHLPALQAPKNTTTTTANNKPVTTIQHTHNLQHKKGLTASEQLRHRKDQEKIYDAESNEVLEDMSVILDRLSGASSNIQKTLVHQTTLIDDAKEEMQTTESMIEVNLQKMDVLLKKSKCGRMGILLILVLSAIGLFFLIIYLP